MTNKKSTAIRSIDAPYFNYWQALYLSFFSGQLYIDVGKRWKRMSISYLFLMTFLFSIPFSIYMTFNFNDYFENQVLLPFKKLPLMYVQNGILSLDKPMPYLIENDSGKIVAIVDTTGKVSNIDATYPDLSILVTKDKLLFRMPKIPDTFNFAPPIDGEVTAQPFDKEMNQVFDGAEWANSADLGYLKLIVNIMLYPIIATVFFFMNLAFYFIFTIPAQVIAKVLLKLDLTFVQTFRLLMVAATPQVFVLLMALALNATFTGMSYTLIIMLAVYFSYAVLSLKRVSNKLVKQ